MQRPQPDETEGHDPSSDRHETKLGTAPQSPEGEGPHAENESQLHQHSGVGLGEEQVKQNVHAYREPPVSPKTSPHPVETILGRGLRRLLQWGIPMSVLGLALPAPSPGEGLLAYVLIHLTLLQAATFVFVIEIAPLTDSPWFGHLKRAWLASSASVIAAAVGFSALLTLATSAAARYDASLQFLQLLSSLDIGWVVAAIYLGGRRMWGNRVATLLGSALLVACVGSIAIYLVRVGFTPAGAWLVDGAELLLVVIPSDVVAAVLSLGVLLLAAVRVDQPTAQPSAQS